MARTKILQTSFIGGIISPTLQGRIDLDLYSKGVEEAENFIVEIHGGLTRRFGTTNLIQVPTGARLFSFEFSVDQSYVFVITTLNIKIYFPFSKVELSVLTFTTPLTNIQLNEMDIIQSADTTIFTHQDFKPFLVSRQGAHTIWSIGDMPLINIPTFNYGTGEEPVWSNARGWIRTCTFHQGRLWFGGSKSKPTTAWGSVVNDFFNFDIGGTDVKPNDALFDVLDTDQFNAIQNIISSTKLQILTAGGEFINNADIITPESSSWSRFTGYGSARLKPVVLDGATYFMDRFRKTVRTVIFDFASDNFSSPAVSIFADSLLNDVVDLDIIRGSKSSSANLLYLINEDGSMAILNTLPKEGINAWTKWTTNGTFKRVITSADVVSVIVERNGLQYLEVLDINVYLDHCAFSQNSNRVEVDSQLVGVPIKVVGDSIVQSSTEAVEEDGKWYAYADSVKENLYAGLSYNVKIKTLPVSLPTSGGNYISQRKRVTKCSLNIYKSRGVYVNGELITGRKFGQDTDVPTPLETGIEKINLLGYNTEGQIEITQLTPDPMQILSLDYEISF